ncbi:MAG: hypothetical protein ABR616_13690 [Dermatophilaceae bacterium]
MARLRHIHSGAVVSVSDEKAARMGEQWQAASDDSDKKPATKRATKKTAAKSSKN